MELWWCYGRIELFTKAGIEAAKGRRRPIAVMIITTENSTDPNIQTYQSGTARCAVIVNKESGTVREVWDKEFESKLVGILRRNGWDPELMLVEGSEIEQTVKDAIADAYDAIVAGGGDGTTTSIASLLRNTEIPLGILPFGTLNLAARDLGTPLDPMEAVESLHPGHSRKIDVLEVNGRTCLCLTIIGVYPELLHKAESFHGRKWWMKFWKMGGRLATAYFRSPRYRIEIQSDDGSVKKFATRFVLIVPGKFKDEWGLIPTREDLETGKCRVYISKHQSRWSNLKMVFRFLSGNIKEDPEMLLESAKSLSIAVKGKRSTKVSLDGELLDLDLPARFDLKRGELRVISPQVEAEVTT